MSADILKFERREKTELENIMYKCECGCTHFLICGDSTAECIKCGMYTHLSEFIKRGISEKN